jgi:hypothetical protein
MKGEYMSELESKLQRRCQKILKDGNAFVFKTHGDMYSRIGIPDLVSCIPVTEDTLRKLLDEGWFKDNKIGIFVGFECKRQGKLDTFDDRRRAQEIVGKEIKNAGGIWFAVDDSDLVLAVLKTMKGEL